MGQAEFRFQREETRKRVFFFFFFFWRNKKREKFDFGEMGIQREEREGVAGFQNFEDIFVFWLYKRLKY